MGAASASVRVTAYGAAGTVTGSKYLVEGERGKILIDCGLFQGPKELRQRNWGRPPFPVDELSAVVLTHAHIDHTGYLPLIVKHGFSGRIYCTAPTADFTPILLLDSAHLQEEEARYANEHHTSKHVPAEPLYTQEDARRTLELFRPLERGARTQVAPGMFVSTTAVGHILGAVALTLEVDGKVITFSGDVGRYNAPILFDPQPLDIGDLLLCESTYGDRLHGDEDVLTELEGAVNRAVDAKGVLLVPAFALGRTQTLLALLGELERAGRIPELPLFVDSPMAMDATEIYRRHVAEHDDEAVALAKRGFSPLATRRTRFCKSSDESKRLNGLSGARIIISASGMATGGRILHHLMRWLPDESTTVLLVGFQAEGTRGRTIESGAPEVKIFGQYVPIRARVEKISALSAHADRGELLRWLKSCRGTPKRVLVVHGEPPAASAFAESLRSEFSWKATPAVHGETVEV